MVPDPILASMASSLAMFVANLAAAEISKQQGVKDDVRRLKKNYERVALMIKSAERKAMVGDDVARYWMKRVKDHMYEVENVVDHWILKNEKRSHPADTECELGSLRWPLNCSMDLSLKRFADAIKALNEDFESIMKLPVETRTEEHFARSYGKTAPDYNADIVGDYVRIDADNIVKLLQDSTSNCRLIAIVGMVGIGKTTLARMIYHSITTGTGSDNHFEIKLWMRFSSDLSSLIMWSDCRKEGPTKAQLLQLGSEIANKSFLLVIDSVWTENVWEALLEGPLQKGNRESSRVIVTTRNKHVAKRIGADHIHYVKKMNNRDAWRLLCQRASLNQSDEVELQCIGKRIVEKCDGLALAIRSIGRTLRGLEPTRHDWENALRTTFQDLSPEEQYIINLSFHDLSSHMKQCFLYCSVFPEGFIMEKHYIIQQWISEGFIEKKRKSTVEEIAEVYFYELIGRGLLHLELANDGVVGAKMPIIIRSFAKDVSDHENFCNESVSTGNLFKPRRLSIVDNNETNNYNDHYNENCPNNGEDAAVVGDNNMGSNHWNGEVRNNTNNGGIAAAEAIVENNEANSKSNMSEEDTKSLESPRLHGLGNMRYLRTLILRKSTVQHGILVRAFKRLTLLRVLDLSEAKDIEVLPVTIGRLEHLRYLNISETNVSNVDNVVSLRMLQYLLLRNCEQIKTLPKGIGRLRNLRNLDIAGTGLKHITWSFRDMEELTSMQGFPMGNNGSLRSLNLKFRKKLDILRIEKLENVSDTPSENEYPVQKYQLKELELCYSRNCERPLVTEDGLNNIRKVLDRFRPHKRLVHLKIENYNGKNYPSWISMLSNLQRLHLRNCLLCEELPSLGQLPQLKFLTVTGFDQLESLGTELRGDMQIKEVAFPRLQQLHIGDMKALHKWSDLEDQDLPNLQIVMLSGCLNLITIPLILQKSKTLMRLEVDNGTMSAIKDSLKGFSEGIVFSVNNQWQQLESSEITTPNVHTSQQDEVLPEPVAPQTESRTISVSRNRFWYSMEDAFSYVTQIYTLLHFERKKTALFMLAASALLMIFCVLLGMYLFCFT